MPLSLSSLVTLPVTAELASNTPEPPPRHRHWPTPGETFSVVLEVHQEDEDWVVHRVHELHSSGDMAKALVQASSLENTLEDNPLWELTHEEDRITASGFFSLDLRYWEERSHDWASGSLEIEYGYTVSNIKHLGNTYATV